MKIFTAKIVCLFDKPFLLFYLIAGISIQSFSQNGVAINTTGAAANASAILDLSNVVNKGFLLPQVTDTVNVASPAKGLVVYQTKTIAGVYFYNGTSWILLTTPANGNGNFILNQTNPTQNPGNFNITGSGTIAGSFTSSGGAINLNSPTSGNNTFATNINVGSATSNNTGIVTIGGNSGNGSQTLNIGTSYAGSSSNTISIGTGTTGSAINNINIGTAATGSGTNNIIIGTNAGINPTTIFSGSGGVSINTGTSTGPVTIGGSGGQTINIGTAFAAGSNTINIGSNIESGGAVNVISGGGGININNTNNKPTNINAGIGAIGTVTIGSSGAQAINVGTSTTGTIGLGSISSTTNIRSGAGAVNINTSNSQPTNINSGTSTGTVTIGGSGNQTISIGSSITNGTISLGNSANDPVTTNIFGGIAGGVNINNNISKNLPTNINTGTTTGNVTIGSTNNNVILPKFSTAGSILFSSTASGIVAATTAGTLGQVLTSSGGGIPTWSSAIPSGSNNYIQNQSASSQTANYWVSGPASIGAATFTLTNQLNVETSGINNNGIVSLNTAATGTGGGDGVEGFTAQSQGAGLWAANTNNSGTGIMGGGNNQTTYYLTSGSGGAFTGNTTGIFAKNISSGAGEAIYTERGPGLAVVRINYYDGSTQYKIFGAGTVSTVAENIDNNSKVVLHAPEAPEILFEDYGEGKLINGKAHINIDPIFSKNVAINDKHPLRVFIQLEGECNGVYVTNKSKTGFDVLELQKGMSNISFQWHIVCNRANEDLGNGKISHNEDMRFEKAPNNLQQLNTVPRKVMQKTKVN